LKEARLTNREAGVMVCRRNSASVSARADSRQQFAKALGKDLVNDAEGSAVHAPDRPTIAPNMIEKTDPIPEYAQPIKTFELSF
jgi:hypothetical protein